MRAQALRGDPETNPVPIALSAAVMIAAVAIEATADLQLDRFIAAAGSEGSAKGICSQGLWGKSFHNNVNNAAVPSPVTIVTVHSVANAAIIGPDLVSWLRAQHGLGIQITLASGCFGSVCGLLAERSRWLLVGVDLDR